jgi:hypothetical protein
MPLRCVFRVLNKTVKKTNAKPPRMTSEEKRLVRSMVFDKQMKPSTVATAIGRDKSSITRLLAQTKATRMGRPPVLTTAQEDRLEKVVEEMVGKADANYEVTLPMVHRRCRLKCSQRTVSRALRSRGYYFFKLYEKMILTPEDVKERWAWAKKYARKTKLWWLRKVQIHLDNHHFKRASTGKGRKLLGKRHVRFVLRKKGKKESRIKSCYVKPPGKLRAGGLVKGVLKCGGVGGGKVLVWETIVDRWSGDKAAEMYTEVIKPALKKKYPSKKRFTILEDNDPTGNMSKKGLAAKAAAKMDLLRIPKRSPDLNVLDYNIWSTVERLMRKQELNMKDAKSETRCEFIRRLDRTAFGLSEEVINDAIGSLQRRCQLLLKAKGGLFVETSRKKKVP